MKDDNIFYIVPRNQEIKISAPDADEAMANFAFTMDSDMNQYFMALDEEGYKQYLLRKQVEKERERTTAFMCDELIEEYEVPEDEAKGVAEAAYGLYVKGDGKTQYECIQIAYDEWEGGH